METFDLNSTTISFHLLLFILFTVCTSSQLIPPGIVCSLITCGQGTCKASNKSPIGVDCVCNPGWKEFQIGPLTFPSCVPNCTIDLQCGSGSPSPPPPPAPIIPPLLNFSDPCRLTWCGDGTCTPNGTEHTCQCYQGSTNLLNNAKLACFKECSFGGDCNGLVFGQPAAPPPPTNSGSPAPPNSSTKLRALTVLLLPAAITVFTWF